MTTAGVWVKGYSLSQIRTASYAKKVWYSFYPGVILKVAKLSLGTSVTVLVNSCLSTFRERMISYAPVDSLMC